MAKSTVVYDDMKLYNTSQYFYISTDNPAETLVIAKEDGNVHISNSFTNLFQNYMPICGILGTVRLISGNYLIVATHRILVGVINDQDIYQLAGFDILPYIESSNINLTLEQIEDDKNYLKMIRGVLETPYLYFSYEYDLTHTMQRLYNTSPEFIKLPMSRRADARFVWNIHLLQDFNNDKCRRFGLPIMHGCILKLIPDKNFCYIVVREPSRNFSTPSAYSAAAKLMNAKKVCPIEIYKRISKAYGNVINEASIREWCTMFNDGQMNIHNKERLGQLAVVTDEFKSGTEETLQKDNHFTRFGREHSPSFS